MKLLKFEIMSIGRGNTVHVYPEGCQLISYTGEKNRPGLLGARAFIREYRDSDFGTECMFDLKQTENFLLLGEDNGGNVKLEVGFLAVVGNLTYTDAKDFERDLPEILGDVEETPVSLYWGMGEERMFHSYFAKLPPEEISCPGSAWPCADKQPMLSKKDVLEIFGKGCIEAEHLNGVKGQALITFFNNNYKDQDARVAEELNNRALQTIVQWGERAVGPLAANALQSANVNNRQYILEDIIRVIEDKLITNNAGAGFIPPQVDTWGNGPGIPVSPHATTKHQPLNQQVAVGISRGQGFLPDNGTRYRR